MEKFDFLHYVYDKGNDIIKLIDTSFKENCPFQFQQDSDYKVYIIMIQIIDLFYLKKSKKFHLCVKYNRHFNILSRNS